MMRTEITMNKKQLIFRNLFYDWRTSLSLLLGIIAGTAVITGALIVGDSVKGSLRQMTFDRLGRVDYVMTGHRFFREELATEMTTNWKLKNDDAVAPAIVMLGSLEYQKKSNDNDLKIRRANQVSIYAIDERFWKMTSHENVTVPKEDEVILSAPVAEQLNVKDGDEITLWIELPSSIPRDSLLGEREETSREVPLKVKTILADDSKVGRFGLKPNQQLPLNAFVALPMLQAALEIDKRRDRKTRTITPARVNTLSMTSKGNNALILAHSYMRRESLPKNVMGFKLADLGLKIVENKERGYLSLESEQMILDTETTKTAESIAAQLQFKTSPVMVYLANEIYKASDADLPEEKRRAITSFYSIVAGLREPKEKPFGPFKMLDEGKHHFPTHSTSPEIMINTELQKVLDAKVGDELIMKYHDVESHGDLPDKEQRFIVAGITVLDNSAADDRQLTPTLKGITDADSFADWDQPFPMKLPVPKHDDEYWNKYRATPKSFITLPVAQNIWKSRYGNLTSFRFAPTKGETLSETKAAFEKKFLDFYPYGKQGLVFQPIKEQGLQAANGTTDFSGLFIGFSFFIILSAAILIGLLFRLGIERRSKQIGLLQAVGFTIGDVRKMLLMEGFILVVVGSTIGLLFAIGYAQLMIYGLKTWWYGAIGTRFLDLYVKPMSLGIGLVITLIVAMIAIWWGVRQLKTLSTRALLAGATEPEETAAESGKWSLRISWTLSAIIILLLSTTVLGLVPPIEAFGGFSWKIVIFFLVGVFSLTLSLLLLSQSLRSIRFSAVQGKGMMASLRLAIRNSARHRQRSVLTVGLIASATFVLVAVAAGHRNPAVEKPILHSGNGGFLLVAQTDQPILFDINNKAESENSDLPHLAKKLKNAKIISFRMHKGENASCLNIYQTKVPTILGVPQEMITRGGFKFADTKGENPWELLNKKDDPHYIPVLGDLNTVQYSLHKGIGSWFEVKTSELVKIEGLFDSSVFQGVLLMSEENFIKTYPNESGYRYFLIDAPIAEQQEIVEALETDLAPYGFDAELVSRRLASFLAVQNTYLSTFQTLGGLGLLLGTFGLATVMLRNVFERRSELALLRAIGFQKGQIAMLVLLENGFLLFCGLVAGTVSALLAMLPHLTSTGADLPVTSGSITLIGIFLLGMFAALFAVNEAIRSPILSSLRSE